MKYYESTFDEYISSCEKENLHDYLELKLPEHIEDVENTIFYGPPEWRVADPGETTPGTASKDENGNIIQFNI